MDQTNLTTAGEIKTTSPAVKPVFAGSVHADTWSGSELGDQS